MSVAVVSRVVHSAVATAVCLFGIAFDANAGGAPQAQGQGPFAAVKAAAARNQQQLQKYSWVSTTQVSYNGEVKSTKVEAVSYGPGGQQQKNVISDTAAPKPPGLRGMIAEKKGAEMQSELESAVELVHSYVPPNPQALQAAVAAQNMQLVPAPPGEATLVFTNYNLPGDALTLTFAVEAKSIQTVDVSTWLGDPSKVVTLVVQFATLPDGTDHPATTTLTLPSSNLQVTVTNSNYQQVVY
jgi:hypothetical protein